MMKTFEELIEQNDFIKNIKRMFIMKMTEKYDIEKVSIVLYITIIPYYLKLI